MTCIRSINNVYDTEKIFDAFHECGGVDWRVKNLKNEIQNEYDRLEFENHSENWLTMYHIENNAKAVGIIIDTRPVMVYVSGQYNPKRFDDGNDIITCRMGVCCNYEKPVKDLNWHEEIIIDNCRYLVECILVRGKAISIHKIT
jgi:hypothetical protein